MKTRILLLAWLVLSGLTQANAATNVVILSDSFQSKIDAAAPGDTLVVQAGAYTGNLNFRKPVTIVRSGTNQLQFMGNTTISAPGAVTFSQAQFVGTVQCATNAMVTLSLSTCSTFTLSGEAMLQAFDCQFNTLNATGGKLTLKRCNFSIGANLNNTAFEALRITSPTFSATAPVGSGLRGVIVQSTFSGGPNLTGYDVWVGYNSCSYSSFTDCNTILVGNAINLSDTSGSLVYVLRGSVRAYNNKLTAGFQIDVSKTVHALTLQGTRGEVVNNTIVLYAGLWDPTKSGILRGIVVSEGSGPITVRANTLRFRYDGYSSRGDFLGIVQDAQQINELSYCCIWMQLGTALSGVSGVNMLFEEPQLYGDYLPGPPCVNAGPPVATSNDRDNTRNDIGHTGGPFWNPANYTTSDPLVFWLMPVNQTVLKGLQSTIPINAAASAGH